jgi:hypothetical protein
MFVSGSTSLTRKTLQHFAKRFKASPHPLQLAEDRLGDGEGCNESAEKKCHGMSQHHKMYQHVDIFAGPQHSLCEL